MMPRRRGRKKRTTAPTIIVRALSQSSMRGRVHIGHRIMRCALGRGGRKAIKREGDGATPIGMWPLRTVFFRADRVARPTTALPIRVLDPRAGWCDAAGDRNYNRFVRHPYPASAERMWRADALYDYVLVLGHNDAPRRRNAGSAIFLHVARAGYSPTEGCVALSARDVRTVLAACRLTTRVVVSA